MIQTLIVFFVTIHGSLSSPEDEIQSLPGLASKPSFRQYSGYLNGGQDIHLHYWFVESQANPSTDPVILWLQGGPGGSSLYALFTENGPLRVSADGKAVTTDPHSWNTLANVLYLESPVGVGFSYYTGVGQYNNTDDTTAQMNHLALEDFFRKFPQFAKNPFYISGESYAGVYIPTLAVEIFRKKSAINLKGVAIGNGALSNYYLTNSAVELALAHGLIDDKTMKKFTDSCCHCNASTGVECYYYQSDTCHPGTDAWNMLTNTFLVNPYNVLDDCPDLALYQMNHRLIEARYNLDYTIAPLAAKADCPMSKYASWLNTGEVRKALHIPDQVHKWAMAGNIHYEIQYSEMKPFVKELVEEHKLGTVIVYNGDLDLMCDFLGDQRFVDSLGYKLVDGYKAWKVNGRIGGFVKRYEGITFTTVRGAGHMVPTDQPEAALEIVKELIGKTKLGDK